MTREELLALLDLLTSSIPVRKKDGSIEILPPQKFLNSVRRDIYKSTRYVPGAV